MIGIYCWTNKQNNKKYIGKSIDILRRKTQHIASAGKYTTEFSKALYQYGLNNFEFEVLEETTIEELNRKETYYIKKYNTHYINGSGYNMNYGGDESLEGENNPNSKLKNEEVLEVRNRIFINKEYPKEVYSDYEDKIGYDRFWSAFHGNTFKNVDTSMIYNLEKNTSGSKNGRTKLTEKDVLLIRNKIHIEKEDTFIVFEDYKELISFSAFKKMLRGETWKNVDTSMIKPITTKREGRPKAKLTQEDIINIRYQYENHIKTISELYLDYYFVSNTTIKRVINYETWKHIKPVSTIPEA